jgi:fumarate reductase flavoprotein subunit
MSAEILGFDLIIVGGGLAGLTAGVRAAELGLCPLVLEQGDGVDYPCNSRQSGGILHIGFHDPYRPEHELVQVIERVSSGEANPALALALAQTGARLIPWLQAHGARFMRFNQQEGYRWCMSPPRALRAGLDWRDRGPDMVLRQLVQKLVALGGMLQLKARVRELLMENGRCIGVQGECDGQPRAWRASACVLADGGFQSNRVLIERFVTPRFASLFQRGARTGFGDGLQMAEAAGAALTDCSRFYGHLLCSDAWSNDQVWPYPEVDSIATAGIVVDSLGRRFVDEGRSGVNLANQVALHANGEGLFAVFDTEIWAGPGTTARIPANPLLERAGGTILRAGSATDLALQMGVPADALTRTLAEYNQALDRGTLGSLEVPRSQVVKPYPVRGQLMAIPISPGITYTMGGIAIDAQAQVLGADETPIPGLFAAGATTGGLEGGKEAAYIGGLIKAGSFGLLAAERIAALAGKTFKVERPTSGSKPTGPKGSANPAVSVAASEPSGLARFPVLHVAVHHGRVVAAASALLVSALTLLLGWNLLGWTSLLLAVVLGAVTLVVVLGLVELVTLVTQFLMPD